MIVYTIQPDSPVVYKRTGFPVGYIRGADSRLGYKVLGLMVREGFLRWFVGLWGHIYSKILIKHAKYVFKSFLKTNQIRYVLN